jgi:hypothetical protein
LMVAIPAAVASHYLEGRISKVFRNIQELMSQLVPRLHAVTIPPAHPPQPLSYRSEAQTNQP